MSESKTPRTDRSAFDIMRMPFGLYRMQKSKRGEYVAAKVARDLETALMESEKLNIEAAYSLADAMNERDHWRAVVDACLRAMPCGNVATHTPENIAGRISEMAQELARQTGENEQLETSLTAETKAVWDATRAMRLLQDDLTVTRAELERLRESRAIEIRDALTVQALRMHHEVFKWGGMDKKHFAATYLDGIGSYERNIAKREGITIE